MASAYNYQMRNFRVGVVLALLCLFAVSLSACGGSRGVNTNSPVTSANTVGENVNTAKTNVEELGLLVNIPYETEDIAWKEDAEHKKLIAVLRFSPEDSKKLVSDVEKSGAPENVSIAVENWFPSELTAQSEMSGDSALKGIAYPANIFFQEPYSTGRITRIEGGDYFVLELTAK